MVYETDVLLVEQMPLWLAAQIFFALQYGRIVNRGGKHDKISNC